MVVWFFQRDFEKGWEPLPSQFLTIQWMLWSRQRISFPSCSFCGDSFAFSSPGEWKGEEGRRWVVRKKVWRVTKQIGCLPSHRPKPKDFWHYVQNVEKLDLERLNWFFFLNPSWLKSISYISYISPSHPYTYYYI